VTFVVHAGFDAINHILHEGYCFPEILQNTTAQFINIIIGVDLGGQPGRAPPIIELGGKGILLPPNNPGENF